MAAPVVITRDEARNALVRHLALDRPTGTGRAGIRRVLERLRCIQLDPLDAIGTNADLVVMARVTGAERGDVWSALFPDAGFEHFAKERCILPASSFPWYRERGHRAQAPWWRHHEREARVEPRAVEAVLEEIRERGPLTLREMTDHGSVMPLDWSGWMGTSKATTMALEILWTRCEVVVAGRDASGAKIYDIPSRTLGPFAAAPAEGDFARWALHERVTAAGLLSRAGGSHWSMLGEIRTSALPDEMIEAGELVEVSIEGSPRKYLALPSFLARRRSRFDDRVRILGPLDPLLWDRNLVRHAFEFEYAWEVYKPEHLRRWGWYVCPLLFRDRLVGRVDARVEKNVLRVKKLWIESEIERPLIRAALEDHARRCGARRIRGI
ncbi:MAG: winged helix DNA-binding domain-containing protein [Thermoanaerobaculia bacterium]